MTKKSLTRLVTGSILLGIVIGAGSFRLINEIGLLTFLDLSEYSSGYNKYGKFVRDFNFRRRANLNKGTYWEDIVNNREFQILTEKEKDKLRNKYYAEIIKPTIYYTDLLPAQIDFFLYAETIENKTKENGFFEEKLPLPRSKVISRHSRKSYIAPLIIKTMNDGYNYYIKISTIKSNTTVETLFIRSGKMLETKVPLGSYTLKYTTGKNWYGEKYLFGPDTSYSKADKTFVFSNENGNISGYTVELFRQTNGNLRTKSISKNDW